MKPAHTPALLIVACLVGCAPVLPAVRVTGRHAELHVDLPPAEARALASEADAFLAAVSGHLGVPPPAPRVFVFKNDWNLWLFLRRNCASFSERAGACFEGEDGTLVVAVSAKENGRPDPGGFRHELTHAVIGANFERPMPWLDEGLAQVFEGGAEPSLDKQRLDQLVGRLPEVESLVLRAVAATTHRKLRPDDYLVAWGLTWYLIEDGGHGWRAVRRCLGPPGLGESPTQRFARCLGRSPEAVARSFVDFLNGRSAD